MSAQSPLQVRPFDDGDETAVVDLWNRCGLTRPWNDPLRDIARKRLVNPEWFLVGSLDGQIVASVMVGYEGHRGWISYLGVSPDVRGRGYGRAMMEEAERLLLDAGCPKLNLQIRKDNLTAIAFYESVGFTEDAVVSYGKRLIPDDKDSAGD